MLNNIKEMILQKKEFQEAADIIFEDGIGNIDDIIVLGEEGEQEENDITTEPDGSESDVETSDEPEEDSDDDIQVDDEYSSSSEEDSDQEPETTEEPESDMTPAQPEHGPNEEPMPLPGGENELPTPIGKQTGEPIEDKDDLLDVTIDLKSNTIRDVLPVPPSNAAEALGGDDDLLNQRIDSGFGGESDPEPQVDMTPAQPPENTEPSETPETSPVESGEPEQQMTEAITLGNDAPADNSAPASEVPPSSDENVTPEDSGEPPAEENSVTSAVRDKVEEITSDESEDGTSTSRDDLLKKLGNITKNLEDAKKAVMNALQ